MWRTYIISAILIKRRNNKHEPYSRLLYYYYLFFFYTTLPAKQIVKYAVRVCGISDIISHNVKSLCIENRDGKVHYRNRLVQVDG